MFWQPESWQKNVNKREEWLSTCFSHHVIFPTCLEAFTIQGGREGGSWEFSKSALAILLWISSKAVRWAEFIIEAIIELWSGWVALLFSTSSFFFYFLFNEFILRLFFFFG